MRLFGLNDLEAFQGVLKFKGAQFFPHPFFKVWIGNAHAAPKHNNIRIVGVEDSHDNVAKRIAKRREHFRGFQIALLGALLDFRGVQAKFALKEPPAAIVFIIFALIGCVADFARAAIGARVKPSANDDARAQAGAR